jgi:hypothetical protein
MIMDREFLSHYHHFMEHILGLWAAHQNFFPGVKVARVIFLTATRSQAGFRSGRHISVNAQIVQTLWPNASVLFSKNIQATLKNTPLLLESVLISDRGGCHKNNITELWGKMNAAHFAEIQKHLPSLRDRIYQAANVQRPIHSLITCHSSLSLRFPIPLLIIDRSENGEDSRRDLSLEIKSELYDRIKSMRVSNSEYCIGSVEYYTNMFNLSIVSLHKLSFFEQGNI